MRNRLASLVIALSLSLVAQAPGDYSGTWKSGASGNEGKLNLTFGSTGLTAASFTLQGQEVKAKPISAKADGALSTFVFEYQIDGNVLRSQMDGTVTEKTIKGKYRSMPSGGGEPVDEGTWEVTLQ